MLALQSYAHRPWHMGGIFAIAAALRLAIFAFTSVPGLLEARPELSTPITSFRSREWSVSYQISWQPVREGVFI